MTGLMLDATQTLFLSTPSARRATTTYQRQARSNTNFYPRPPRGGRLARALALDVQSIFLSTPSARRATHLDVVRESFFPISIHALREEGDKRPCNSYP